MIPRRAQSPVRWVLLAAIVVTVLVGAGMLVLRVIRPSVTVTEAVTGPVVQAFYSTGTIQPEREYPIRSNVAGVLTSVSVDKGDPVTTHQSLAVVEDPELRYKAEEARAQLEESQARAKSDTSPVLEEYRARIKAGEDLLEIAQRDEARYRELIGRNAASQTDLDRAVDRVKLVWTDLQSAKAQMAAKQLELAKDVKLAEARLNIANWNLEQQTLKSPIDGTVLDRPRSLGTRVAINDEVLRIADVRPEHLVMRAAVDEEDITQVHEGQVVRMTLYAFPGRTFRGTVDQIYAEADPGRRTFEVDVRLDEPNPRLQPGMTGELAFIVASREKAVVVPSQAVQNGTVYTVREGRIVRADTEIGLTSIERAEVTAGLEPGEQVVISPIGELEPGQAVRPSYVDPQAAAGLNKATTEETPFTAFR